MLIPDEEKMGDLLRSLHASTQQAGNEADDTNQHSKEHRSVVHDVRLENPVGDQSADDSQSTLSHALPHCGVHLSTQLTLRTHHIFANAGNAGVHSILRQYPRTLPALASVSKSYKTSFFLAISIFVLVNAAGYLTEYRGDEPDGK